MHFEILLNTGVQHLEKMIIQLRRTWGSWLRIGSNESGSNRHVEKTVFWRSNFVTRSVRIHAENFIVDRLKKEKLRTDTVSIE